MRVTRLSTFRLLILFVFLAPILPRIFTVYVYIIILGLSLLHVLHFIRILNKMNAKMLGFTAAIFSYSIVNFLINSFSTDALVRLVQLTMCSSVFLAIVNHNWNFYDIAFVRNIVKWLVVLIAVLWPFYGFVTKGYSALYTNSNALGAAVFCYIALLYMTTIRFEKSDIICVFLALVLLVISDNRSVLMATLIFLIGKSLFTLFEKKNIGYKWLFGVMLLLVIAVPIIYIYLFNSTYKEVLNTFSLRYFRKYFFTGRQILWVQAMKYIKQNFLWGNGLGVTLQVLAGGDRSTHNWYIQVLLQMGVFGLVILLIWIVGIWNTLYSKRESIVSREASAFLLGVLVWQCFEVTITQNNLPSGIAVWLVLGIGMSGSKIEKELCNRGGKNDSKQRGIKILS